MVKTLFFFLYPYSFLNIGNAASQNLSNMAKLQNNTTNPTSLPLVNPPQQQQPEFLSIMTDPINLSAQSNNQLSTQQNYDHLHSQNLVPNSNIIEENAQNNQNNTGWL